MSGLNYRIDGRGPRLVLLHPVGLDLTFFNPLVAELSRRFRMLRIDAAGHGGSPSNGGPGTLRGYAEDLHALLTQLKWTPAAIAGFSFGGMIAQTLALEHPADVSALIIAACAPTFSDEMRQAIADRGAAALREGIGSVVAPTMERWFSAAYLAQPASQAARRRLASNSVEGWKHAWQAISGVDTLGRLPSVQVPTLCLAGSDDKSAPPGVVQTIADAIPGARMEVLPNAAHMFFIEHPRETATAITAFLTSMPAR